MSFLKSLIRGVLRLKQQEDSLHTKFTQGWHETAEKQIEILKRTQQEAFRAITDYCNMIEYMISDMYSRINKYGSIPEDLMQHVRNAEMNLQVMSKSLDKNSK